MSIVSKKEKIQQRKLPRRNDSFFNKLNTALSYPWRDSPFILNQFDYEKYWKELWREDVVVTSLYKYKLTLTAKIIEPGSSILDLGCGDGRLLKYLKETRNIEAHGVEFSRAAAEQAKANGLDVTITDLTQFSITAGLEYDYIILSEVIEHLSRPEDLLQKLHSKFKQNIIISIPNSGFILDRLRLLIGRFPRQWGWHPSEHLRFWTVPDFLFWCQRLGYRVDKFYGLKDEYYDIKLPLWKWYPRLFARHILYQLSSNQTDNANDNLLMSDSTNGLTGKRGA